MTTETQLLTPRRRLSELAAPARAAALKFSGSGRFLFQRQGRALRVLNAKNGALLHECARQGEGGELTAVALHPHNELQLLAAYADGAVLVWDFVEEKPLQEMHAGAPVLWMESSVASPSVLLLVLSDAPDAETDEELRAKWTVAEFSLKKKKVTRRLTSYKKHPFHTAAMKSYRDDVKRDDGDFQGDFFVAAAGSRIINVRVHREREGEAATDRKFTMQRIKHIRDVSCVAVNPSAPEFAVGDSVGQIYRYVDDATGAASMTGKMHWHSHAVLSLTFSSDGKFLFSGGEECVLVSWNLESGRRAFLPRRSAPIQTIAPTNPEYASDASAEVAGGIYAVALEDNVVFQYNAVTREEEWHTLGLARSGESAARTLPSRQITFDPISLAMPLNGMSTAGVLQFYDAYKDRVLQSVILTERNQVTRTEDEEIPNVMAENVCFSANGQDMVTVHTNVYKSRPNSKEEQSLRFWKRRADGSFVVNTAVDSPHGSARVTSLAFSRGNGYIVTGDSNGEFKLWKQVQEVRRATAEVSAQPTISWACQSAVKFRDASITATSFSSDGSLLAVAYGHLLTLWDVATNALKQVISSADGQPISSISFTGVASPYVILTTSTQVQVWNLLQLELWWRYDVPEGSAFVSADAQREQFLVWVRLPSEEAEESKSVVLVFSPKSPVPVAISPLEVRDAGVWGVAFHPKKSDVIVLDTASNVWRVGGLLKEPIVEDEDEEEDVAAAAEHTPNALNALYKAVSTSHKKKAHMNEVRKGGVKQGNSLFEAPAHVLPSMTALYRSYMDTMLPKPHQATSNGTDENVDKKSKKKHQNKKRKKQQQQQQPDTVKVEDGEGQKREKRAKQLVAKELANEALQKQTYSKLLETFRNKRPSKKAH